MITFRIKPTFRAVMEANGVDQARLAEITGYSRPEISMFLNGKRSPSWQFLRKVAESFGCKAENIIETVDTPERKGKK